MDKRSNNAAFIEKARAIHGDKYDYSKVVYQTNKTKVVITCSGHGDFAMRPDGHLWQKQGCPKCGRDRTTQASVVHGHRYMNTYNNWKAMMTRCFNKKNDSYKIYGNVGRTVEPFLQDMANYHEYVSSLPMYDKKDELNLTIDRIDNNKGYERGNLRWATKSEQATNTGKRRNNKIGYTGIFKLKNKFGYRIEYNGVSTSRCIYDTIEQALTARNQYIVDNNLPHKIQEYKG